MIGPLRSFQYGDSRYNRRMASDPKPYVPFSQRTGLEPIPPQLKLGEVSAELRRDCQNFRVRTDFILRL